MQDGTSILREVAEAADSKFHDSIDKSMEWGRVECKRRLKLRDSHPYPIDLVMREFREVLHYVRGLANREIQANLPELNMRGGDSRGETESMVAAALHTTRGGAIAPEAEAEVAPSRSVPLLAAHRQPDRAGVSKQSMESIGEYLSQRIAGTTWGQLYGRQLPPLLKNHEAIAGGALKISYVLKKLAAIVSPDDQVADVISDDQMGQLFAEAESKKQTYLGQGVALLG